MAAVTSRYARALADVVFSAKLDANKTVGDLEAISQLLESSPELRIVLESPSVPSDQKRKLLDALAAKLVMARQVRNFIAILIDQRRLGLMSEMIAQIKAELNERMGFADAEVTSARALGDDERHTLEAQISKVTGKTVRARYAQDKTLLGGAVVKVGSTIYDGSVRGQLQKIKAQMAGL